MTVASPTCLAFRAARYEAAARSRWLVVLHDGDATTLRAAAAAAAVREHALDLRRRRRPPPRVGVFYGSSGSRRLLSMSRSPSRDWRQLVSHNTRTRRPRRSLSQWRRQSLPFRCRTGLLSFSAPTLNRCRLSLPPSPTTCCRCRLVAGVDSTRRQQAIETRPRMPLAVGGARVPSLAFRRRPIDTSRIGERRRLRWRASTSARSRRHAAAPRDVPPSFCSRIWRRLVAASTTTSPTIDRRRLEDTFVERARLSVHTKAGCCSDCGSSSLCEC